MIWSHGDGARVDNPKVDSFATSGELSPDAPRPGTTMPQRHQPDVVIVDSGDPADDPMPAVMRILREGVGIKVIGLNLQDNTMCIYRGEQRVVKEVKDLVEAIESSPLSPEPMSSEDLAKVAEPRERRSY